MVKKTLDAIKKPEVKSGHTQYVNYNRIYNVPVPKPVAVPSPTVYTVPYVKYEYVPVEEPCDPCCCGKKGGVAKILNHTEVNWVSGKEGDRKTRRSVRNSDPNDSSEENQNGPKNWGEVVARFNAMNGEKNALSASGILTGNEEEEASRNLEMLSRVSAGSHHSVSEETQEESEDFDDYAGLLRPDAVRSVRHWNTAA